MKSSLKRKMTEYVITRKMNSREFYLENIDHDNHATWIKDKHYALRFGHAKRLEDFIQREFPNKGYYVTSIP